MATTKNDMIEKQLDSLTKQREDLIEVLKRMDHDKLQDFQKKTEIDLQINKIDLRIDLLLEIF